MLHYDTRQEKPDPTCTSKLFPETASSIHNIAMPDISA